MTELNASIRDIPLPPRMARLPISERGYPVPWFVARINNQWDFRAIRPNGIARAHNRKLCWLCGEPLGQYLAFVIGPMCSINRVSSEPPSHRECAEYAVKACPFLTKPNMRRNEEDVPEGTVAGEHIMHNPGATLIWITKSYRPVSDGSGGVLFEIGPPHEVYFFREGRQATRDEIMDAINKGLPYLRAAAATEEGATEALNERIADAMKVIEAAA